MERSEAGKSRNRGALLLLSGWLWGILAGCALEPISPVYQREARNDISIGMIQQTPEKYIGAVVIWGGRIIALHSTRFETEITVMQIPLDPHKTPVNPADSQGRFIAKMVAWDPQYLQQDVYLTLAGKITGVETRLIGGTRYIYPVVRILQYHPWDKRVVLQ